MPFCVQFGMFSRWCDMWNIISKILSFCFDVLKLVAKPVGILGALFCLMCGIWLLIFYFRDGKKLPKRSTVYQKKRGLFYQLLFQVPRRYALDLLERDPDTFDPHGIHMFCGAQGAGKTIGCVEMMLRLRKKYPKSKMITNFAVAGEDDELAKWEQLLTYTNGCKGVIVGIDEIQNWFMSGKNQLPEGMLEVATQNRKNRRILCCTAQVFTRVNKALREQTTLVYQPFTFLKCFTIVLVRKPELDAEGNLIRLKHRRMYSFVHTDELRQAYDTYKVIHTLAMEGFKPPAPQQVTNVFVQQPDGKKK